MTFSQRLTADWYRPHLTALTAALWPLSLAFRAAVALRRFAYRSRLARAAAVGAPVVVVGSIVVGGTGKTPLVRALCAALAAAGRRPGIVTRGYGGSNVAPRAVVPGDDPAIVGDESLLHAGDGFPVWIGHDRAAAARALLAAGPDCDGAVVDAARGCGNGCLLPAGPLREPRARLDRVDAVVRLVEDGSPRAHGERESTMSYEPLPWRNLVQPGLHADLDAWRRGAIHALAGIGDPARFFALLRRLGLEPVCHVFPDHYRYAREELRFPGATAVLMTEKDAVKCVGFADARFWCLPIRAHIDPALVTRVTRTIRGRQAA